MHRCFSGMTVRYFWIRAQLYSQLQHVDETGVAG